MDYLALYSKKCKVCKFLDPEEKVEYLACHFSKGNTECPAKEVQVAVVGQAKRYAELVKKARSESNIKQEMKILEYVSKRSAAFQHKFREWS